MSLDRSALLAQAVAPVLARVRAHRDQLDYPGRALLRYLEGHVYDPGLKVSSWRAACKVRSVTTSQQVKAVIGTSLAAYLEELRVETAMRLLMISKGELTGGEAGMLVGYERHETFRQVFTRRTTLTPGAYRAQVLRLHALGRRPPDPVWVRAGWLKQFAEGKLDRTEALMMIEAVEAACGLPPCEPSPEPPIETVEDFERLVAEVWWSQARTLPIEELNEQVLQPFKLRSPALCRHLLKRVEAESRSDPARGVEVAELAVESAEALRAHLEAAELSSLLARSWAWLGHARRQAGDAVGAAAAFARATACLAEHAAPPVVHAEVLRLEAG